jgi:hypothetical protein
VRLLERAKRQTGKGFVPQGQVIAGCVLVEVFQVLDVRKKYRQTATI